MALITTPRDPWAGHMDPLAIAPSMPIAPPPASDVRCFRKRTGAVGYLCCEETYDADEIGIHLLDAHEVEEDA